MVRVGGGWELLEEFLLKHDPCRGENEPSIAAISDLLYEIIYYEIIIEEPFKLIMLVR